MILDKSFPKETDYVKEHNIPLVIVGGTVEYHGAHCSYGCDTLIAEGLVPLGRWGQPNDIAKAVVALCDGTFGYTTGQSFILDGGMHIRKL